MLLFLLLLLLPALINPCVPASEAILSPIGTNILPLSQNWQTNKC